MQQNKNELNCLDTVKFGDPYTSYVATTRRHRDGNVVKKGYGPTPSLCTVRLQCSASGFTALCGVDHNAAQC
jgi:hypothetical protein